LAQYNLFVLGVLLNPEGKSNVDLCSA